jgi:hypothetical protein
VASEVRGVVIRGAVGGLGEDDEFFTSLEMQGLSAAWLPGDHGVCLVIGGGLLKGVPLEPALTIVVAPKGLRRLAAAFAAAPRAQSPNEAVWDLPVSATTIELGVPARRPNVIEFIALGGQTFVTTYKSEIAPLAFASRPFVMEIRTHHHRFRVYLTADEVDDLNTVLRYQPPWLAD